ncbi:FAD-binding oxidoreductase, partial [Phyllobacterium sp. P5_D12]
MIADKTLNELRLIVGASGVKTSEALSLIHPGSDERNLDAGVIVVPRDTGEVAAVLRLCNEHRIAVVPHGGRTGLVGGGVSAIGEIILSLAALNKIESLSADGGTAVVESGVT